MAVTRRSLNENFDSFIARITNVMSEEDRMWVELAYVIAKAAHRHQERQEQDARGNPVRYFEHPRGVTLILVDEFKCYDPVVIQTGLLHDVVEDHKRITNAHIRLWFGSNNVARFVQCLTHKKGDNQYPDHLIDIGEWVPMLVKFCDRLDNMRSIDSCSPKKQKKQAIETRDRYYPVFTELQGVLPHRYRMKLDPLYDELRGIVNGILSQPSDGPTGP